MLHIITLPQSNQFESYAYSTSNMRIYNWVDRFHSNLRWYLKVPHSTPETISHTNSSGIRHIIIIIIIAHFKLDWRHYFFCAVFEREERFAVDLQQLSALFVEVFVEKSTDFDVISFRLHFNRFIQMNENRRNCRTSKTAIANDDWYLYRWNCMQLVFIIIFLSMNIPCDTECEERILLRLRSILW